MAALSSKAQPPSKPCQTSLLGLQELRPWNGALSPASKCGAGGGGFLPGCSSSPIRPWLPHAQRNLYLDSPTFTESHPSLPPHPHPIPCDPRL